jgi:LacI family transcriptional regulator
MPGDLQDLISGKAARRRPGGAITIRDVAAQAGVSVQTVSRVLNERPDVSAATRALVTATMGQLGYQPSALARGLVSRRSATIGVVVSGLGFVGTARSLSGTIEAAAAHGLTVLVNQLEVADPQGFPEVVRPLVRHQVEGLVYCGPEAGGNIEAFEAVAAGLSVPLVFAHCTPAPGRAAVTIDNRTGVEQAVDHLVAGGRRRIGHISGPASWAEAQQRRDGWRRAMARHGLDTTGLLVEGDWTSRSGKSAFQLLHASAPDLDAVVAANDQTALGAMAKAREIGFRMPHDLAVVGFDDIDDAEMFAPPLTSIRQPLAEAGRTAVALVMHLIDREAHPRPTTELGTQLVVRDSSAPRLSAPGST